jgi:predicted transcriptional regulator
MTLEEIRKILEAEVLVGDDLLDLQIKMACGSDLMSDVLSFVKSEALLLTGLTNLQVVRTAEMADLAAICFVRGKRPDLPTIEIAKAKNIPLFMTPLPMFESCGRLWMHGLPGCSEYQTRREAKRINQQKLTTNEHE